MSRDLYDLGLSRDEVFYSLITPYEKLLLILWKPAWLIGSIVSVWINIAGVSYNDTNVFVLGMTMLWLNLGIGSWLYLSSLDHERLGYYFSFAYGQFLTRKPITSKKNDPMLNMVRSFYLRR